MNRGNSGGGFSRGGSSFRGSQRGGGGGFQRGGGGGFQRGGRGGGGGGFRRDNNFQQSGPPSRITAAGSVMHPCEDQIVVRCDQLANDSVPYFNGRVFLENKTEIGKIDEILGPLTNMYISVKTSDGVKPESIPAGTTVFIDPMQQLPLDRFLPKPAAPKKKVSKRGAAGAPKTGGSPGGFGQRGGSSRGGFRGGSRGGQRGGQRGGARNFRGGSGNY